MIWAIAVALAAGFLVVFLSPVEWWGWLHDKPIPPDWSSIPKHRGMEYRAYLATDAWQQRRRYLIARAGHRCQVCNGREVLQLDHRTYERLGDECLDDLLVICKLCHEAFHHARRVNS